MRILVLSNLYPNPYEPHRATFNRQQFRALAMEHDVRVIAPIAWTGEWSARRRNKYPLLTRDRKRLCDGMVIHHPRFAFTPRMLRGWHGRFLTASIRRCFHNVVGEFRPDVVLGCWAYPDGWAAVRLAREANLPVVIKVHGSDLLTIGNQLGKGMRTAEALVCADAVIAVSRNLAGRALAMGADAARVHVVYNGVDTTAFHPGPRALARQRLGLVSPDPLVLFVGNLVPVKGLDVLIDALTSLANGGQRFQCAMVGNGPLKAQLQSRINSLGLSNRVRLLGARPLEELPTWYQASSLVVLPSRSEGVPNVLLEATACGIPFVASDVGGIPEIAPAESLVPPGDAAALAERISVFLNRQDSPVADVNFRAGSWNESAAALAAVLRGVVADCSSKPLMQAISIPQKPALRYSESADRTPKIPALRSISEPASAAPRR